MQAVKALPNYAELPFTSRAKALRVLSNYLYRMGTDLEVIGRRIVEPVRGSIVSEIRLLAAVHVEFNIGVLQIRFRISYRRRYGQGTVAG